jgi:hypothetical protein
VLPFRITQQAVLIISGKRASLRQFHVASSIL